MKLQKIISDSRVPTILMILFGGVLFFQVVLKYISIHSGLMDLGIFSNNLDNVDNDWQRAFHGHVQPLMLIWSYFYKNLPFGLGPVVLIAFQAITLLGVIVVMWRFVGPIFGAVTLIYYPFWANALFDFHFDHLALVFLLLFFCNCERRNFVKATLWAALLVLIKEPFALQAVACGIYLIIIFYLEKKSFKNLNYLGCALIFWGFFWFYASIQWVMPYFGDGQNSSLNSSAFSWLGTTIPEIVKTILTRPWYVFGEVFDNPNKLFFLFVIFGLLAFIPLLRPKALIVALPLLSISLLSGLENYYSYANHYTAGIIVPIIFAFRDSLPVVQDFVDKYGISKRIFLKLLFVYMLIGHWSFSSSPISRLFWSDKVWSYSWQAYIPTERESMMKAAMLEHIPSDRDVSVTSQNTVNWGHMAHRKAYLPFPMGVIEPHKIMNWSDRDLSGLWRYIITGYKTPVVMHDRYADIVVLDLKRPWFVVDKGCDWLYKACRNEAIANDFLQLVSKTQLTYETVLEKDNFMILKRRI